MEGMRTSITEENKKIRKEMQELKKELKIMITNNAETAKKFERQTDKRLEKLEKNVNTEEQENKIAEMEAKLVMIKDRLKGNKNG